MVSAVMQAFCSTIKNAGLGLRACHYPYILKHLPDISWFEALTENYMVAGGMALERLAQIRAHYPITFHGVGMSIGSTDPLNHQYLSHLKRLIHQFEPAYISDHLCWTSLYQQYSHELLPLPYSEETVVYVAERIRQVQDFLGQQILLENVSSYLTFADATLSEWEFLNAVAEQADCFILLDINNVYVSGHNHGFNPYQYLAALNKNRIMQIHLAGYQDVGTHLLDHHGAKVSEPVWQLYAAALKKLGQIPTCIEWDNKIPEFSVLWQETEKVKLCMEQANMR